MKPFDHVWFFDETGSIFSGLVQSVHATYVAIMDGHSIKRADLDKVFPSLEECRTAQEQDMNKKSQEYLKEITDKDSLINFMLKHMSCTDANVLQAIYTAREKFKEN